VFVRLNPITKVDESLQGRKRKIKVHDCNSTNTGAAAVLQNPELSSFLSHLWRLVTKIFGMVSTEPFKCESTRQSKYKIKVKAMAHINSQNMNGISKTGQY